MLYNEPRYRIHPFLDGGYRNAHTFFYRRLHCQLLDVVQRYLHPRITCQKYLTPCVEIRSAGSRTLQSVVKREFRTRLPSRNNEPIVEGVTNSSHHL